MTQQLNKPAGTVPSDGAIKLFSNILGDAYASIMRILTNGDLTDDAVALEKAAQIEGIARELDIDMRSWVSVEVPAFYEIGMFEAMKGLHERGSNVLFSTSFANFHREAIEAITQETYASIAEGMTGITRTGNKVLSMAKRERVLVELAKGDILGKDRKTIAKRIAQVFEDDGITALVDRGGKQWDLLTYGEMLSRTKLTQAHNTGTINRMVESGYDLVEVSEHTGSCPLCQPWQGQILSATGRTPAYESLDNAIAYGLFHPNCRHTVTPYHKAYLDKAVVWDAAQQKYVPYLELRAAKRQTFSNALSMHTETSKLIGVAEAQQFNKFVEAGNVKEASKYVTQLPDDVELKPSMQRLVGLMR